MNFLPFSLRVSTTSGCAAGPVVKTAAAPPSVVPALQEPSVYVTREVHWGPGADSYSKSSFLVWSSPAGIY